MSKTPNGSGAQAKLCYHCGRAGHTAGVDRHKESVCHKCNKTGHLHEKLYHSRNQEKGSEHKQPQDAAVFQLGTGTTAPIFVSMELNVKIWLEWS